MPEQQNPNQMSRLFQSAGSAQAKQGTGYTNLGRLMSASKDNLLGQKVAGTIGSQIGGVQSQLAEQQKAFGEESEKNKIGSQKDVEQREAVLGRFTSPSGAGGDVTDEDVSAFERFRGGQYAGPQGLKDTSALKGTAQQLQGQVSSFSPSGTQELLRRSVGGDRYTQGQQRLDTLLMDKSKLTPIARQAQGLGQQISRADLAASGQAELQKNLAQQFAKETQEKLTGGMGGIETDVQKRLAEAQLAEGTRQANLQAVKQFQQDPSKRGGGTISQQADVLRNLLVSQNADQEQMKQLFGTGDLAAKKAAYDAEVAAAQFSQHLGETYSSLDKQRALDAALAKYSAPSGLVGQAVLGGTQEQFYKDLATRLANSAPVQNLTGQGLASTQQRASYEALNKLLGRTPSEAKYKTVQQQINPLTGKPIEDTSFYKAGEYKLI